MTIESFNRQFQIGEKVKGSGQVGKLTGSDVVLDAYEVEMV
ncbi:MAG: hypothetical protein ABII96_02400 [Candidatus Zixiibacteriota bacterium]